MRPAPDTSVGCVQAVAKDLHVRSETTARMSIAYGCVHGNQMLSFLVTSPKCDTTHARCVCSVCIQCCSPPLPHRPTALPIGGTGPSCGHSGEAQKRMSMTLTWAARWNQHTVNLAAQAHLCQAWRQVSGNKQQQISKKSIDYHDYEGSQ